MENNTKLITVSKFWVRTFTDVKRRMQLKSGLKLLEVAPHANMICIYFHL